MLFSNLGDFLQNIRWEYVFIFLMMIGFTIESYLVYRISQQHDAIQKEYEEVKKENDRLLKQLNDEIESLHNIFRNVRSV